ncbi:hypothetical protein MtrunA17_Chr2g0299551 [Medicago truncatula]|uniref:Transmembrane protein, putative n=1 Tax=Medicago truncatula TaxID=3880 RepID=G7IIM1_MEDTR|nr:transmembrane protein, putative [Medicago truncatula]RHN73536.1 hypothetical protein MtrunA17_Chr2g0299551 [Medicago truncatula]
MAAWSSDGPEGPFVQNVSVGTDICRRSLEVDFIKMNNQLKELKAKLRRLKFLNLLLMIGILLSLIPLLFYKFK